MQYINAGLRAMHIASILIKFQASANAIDLYLFRYIQPRVNIEQKLLSKHSTFDIPHETLFYIMTVDEQHRILWKSIINWNIRIIISLSQSCICVIVSDKIVNEYVRFIIASVNIAVLFQRPQKRINYEFFVAFESKVHNIHVWYSIYVAIQRYNAKCTAISSDE